MIKAVLFDVDGVLLDSREANAEFFRRLLRKAGYKIPPEKEFHRIFHISLWDSIKILTREKSEDRIRRLWEYASLKENYPYELLEGPSGLKETIEKLSKKYKLGIVTSRVTMGVEDFFDYSGLQSCFDVVVAFEDYKNPKPDPECLILALNRLKVEPSNAVYVGDSRNDLIAARKAGVNFILYSHQYPLLKAKLWTNDFGKIPRLISLVK